MHRSRANRHVGTCNHTEKTTMANAPSGVSLTPANNATLNAADPIVPPPSANPPGSTSSGAKPPPDRLDRGALPQSLGVTPPASQVEGMGDPAEIRAMMKEAFDRGVIGDTIPRKTSAPSPPKQNDAAGTTGSILGDARARAAGFVAIAKALWWGFSWYRAREARGEVCVDIRHEEPRSSSEADGASRGTGAGFDDHGSARP